MSAVAGPAFGVSYFGVRDLDHVRRDLDEIAEAGFTAVTHTFSEHDLRYHVGDLARIVEETRRRGLEAALDPWGVAGLFGGEAYSELALTNLPSRQVDANGDSVPACCPNAKATRELLRRWTVAATELGPDVLFWDEPHFYLGAYREAPSPPCCRCDACRAAWRELADGDLPPEGASELEIFRTRSLRELLEDAIASAGREIRHSLCLLPRGEFVAGSDDWDSFTTLPGIDRLATDPYWMDRPVDPASFVRKHSEDLREVCRVTGKEMEIWIQGIRIPAGEERVLGEAVESALASGADRVCFWSFRGTGRMSHLSCGDPEAAWDAMKQAAGAARSGKP